MIYLALERDVSLVAHSHRHVPAVIDTKDYEIVRAHLEKQAYCRFRQTYGREFSKLILEREDALRLKVWEISRCKT